MPSRNRLKIYAPEAYYHIYNRGVNKQEIFQDTTDYAVFLNLLKRYLDKEHAKDKKGREYENMYGQMELLAFCLMPNHFHLLIYQVEEQAMTTLLHRVTGSYVRYFNKRHRRNGPLFQDRFKASMVSNDDYLLHISRYIHLNPRKYESWEFSSLPYYLGFKQAEWVKPERVITMFKNNEYGQFLMDYEGYKKMLEEIKHDLANE